jgi:adenylyl cyclase-associated protein
VFKNKVWTVENYVNENVKFSGDEEVHHTYVLNFFACRDAEIHIEGKVKSILLEGCKKVSLFVDSVVSEINVMNSSGVKIFAKK